MYCLSKEQQNWTGVIFFHKVYVNSLLKIRCFDGKAFCGAVVGPSWSGTDTAHVPDLCMTSNRPI